MSVSLLAVAFNHDPGSAHGDALNIRRNASRGVTVPEWRRGSTSSAADSVAAYSIEDVLDRTVAVQARIACRLPGVSAVQVRAVQPPLPPVAGPWQPWWPWLLEAHVNVLGEVATRTVPLGTDGTSDFVTFPLRNTRLATCGVGVHLVRWHWQYRLRASETWRPLETTEHVVYTVLRAPRAPWVQQPATLANTQLPWTDVLDLACRWARGARTAHDAAAAVTRSVFSLGDGVLDYDCSLGATAYAFDVFLLTELLERLHGGLGRGAYVNCVDCATIVSTFANALGADLWQSRMGGPFTGVLGYFPVNPVRTIGARSWSLPCGWWPGWTFHEVGWAGECTAEDAVFDACLQLDAYPPFRVALFATNLRFGRSGERAYRDLLATPEGRGLCEPMPFSRRRRPVI